MLFSTTLAALAAFVPLTSAHGSSGLPKIVGVDLDDLRVTNMVNSLRARSLLSSFDIHDKTLLNARKDDRECGAGIGSCPEDKCCSLAGYCGTSSSHCYSPGCDYTYGPACPENITPKGTNTSSIPRTKVGSVPYGGTGIYKCKNPGTIALTYDDGPMKSFTSHILDVFKKYNGTATFFITGNNIGKGQIDLTDEYVEVIKRMDTEGHQIASHTWTHLNLTQISSLERKNQIWKNEMALYNIVGKIPTYLRPPYSSCDAACQQDMSDLGYHLAYFDVDTDDYHQVNATHIQNSKDWFKGNITKSGASPTTNDWLTISHDIIEQTANNLTEYMLSTLTQLGYKAVTLGECLGDPKENWYRTFGDEGNSSSATQTTDSSSANPSQSQANNANANANANASSQSTSEKSSGSTIHIAHNGGLMSLVLVATLSLSFAAALAI